MPAPERPKILEPILQSAWMDGDITPRQRKKRKEAIKTKMGHYEQLSNGDLQKQTTLFRERLSKGESLDKIANEAFATVCEAARRVLGYKEIHDVQILGALTLYEGKIAEMKTGEGKTLVVALAAYVKALEGNGVHAVTANDYLAKRDAEEMADLYKFLGLNVDGGIAAPGMTGPEKQKAYKCDITYGTAREFAFDYLRDEVRTDDRLKLRRKDENPFVIIDEVDEVLLDEANTPLILTSEEQLEASEAALQEYLAQVVFPQMEKGDKKDTGDYYYDQETQEYGFTESGIAILEGNNREGEPYGSGLNLGNLFEDHNRYIKAFVDKALEAQVLRNRGEHYIVENGEILPLRRGRPVKRRFEEGLHQALEAKEGLKIRSDKKTNATISVRDYFSLFDKSGTTGTGQDAADELEALHGLKVEPITPNHPVIRDDHPDIIYRTKKEQFESIVDDIVDRYYKGQPVLVGTNGEEALQDSKKLADMLRKKGIPYRLLNAENNANEAEIIAQAGRRGAVTIATEMVGRGTDILLGGNPKYVAAEQEAQKAVDRIKESPRGDLVDKYELVKIYQDVYQATLQSISQPQNKDLFEKYKQQTAAEAEEVMKARGLYVIGVGQPDTKRAEKQLRGRAGRQGNPGESQLYLSLKDPLLTKGLDERTLTKLRTKYSRKPDDISVPVPIDGRDLRHYFKRVQQTRMHNEEAARRHSLDFDKILEEQRQTIYGNRETILKSDNIENYVYELIKDVVGQAVRTTTTGNSFIDVTADEAKFQTQISRLTYPPRKWNFDQLWETIDEIHPVDTYFEGFINLPGDNKSMREATDDLKVDITDKLKEAYDDRRSELREQFVDQFRENIRASIVEQFGEEGADEAEAQYADKRLYQWERETVLKIVDREWQEYLYSARRLQATIQTRSLLHLKVFLDYGVESRREFNDMRIGLQKEILIALFNETPKDLVPTNNT